VQTAISFAGLAKCDCAEKGFTVVDRTTTENNVAFLGDIHFTIMRQSAFEVAKLKAESFVSALLGSFSSKTLPKKEASRMSAALRERERQSTKRKVFTEWDTIVPKQRSGKNNVIPNAALAPSPAKEQVTIPGLSDSPEQIDLNLGIKPEKLKTASEYELNLGKCLDTLQQEVPYFAEREFSWDIYTRDISFGDPTGEKIRGIKAYQTFFSTLRALRSIMYSDVQVTKNKIRYDWNGKRIIVRWQSTWTMKGARKPAYVDAVSYLSLNDKGLIYKHELDNVNINGQDVNPNYAAGFVGMQELAVAGIQGKVPSYGFGDDSEEAKYLLDKAKTTGFAFDTGSMKPKTKPAITVLPSNPDLGQRMKDHPEQTAVYMVNTQNANPPKKRPETMESSAEATSDKAEKPKRKKQAREKPKWRNIPGTCDGVWDCDAGMECCDYNVAKFCCSGGVGIPAMGGIIDAMQNPFGRAPQPGLVPIPIPVTPPGMKDPSPPASGGGYGNSGGRWSEPGGYGITIV
jgi:hypothetical protein